MAITGWQEFLPLERAMATTRNLTEIQWGSRIHRQRHKVVAVQRLRLFVLDVGVPVALGLLSVLVQAHSLIPFVARVLSGGTGA